VAPTSQARPCLRFPLSILVKVVPDGEADGGRVTTGEYV
jgi:hypothetical protein